MNYRLWLLIGLLAVSWVTAAAAERQLAGIRIGMRPKEVFEMLGDPTALLMAQPPLTEDRPIAELGALNMGMATQLTGGDEKPTTLVFLYKDQEIELTSNTGLAVSDADKNGLPLWAYMVRVAKLALDQQELIYRLNDVYSLGITITGQGNEAKVTDIIACNLAPLTVWPADPVRKTPARTFDRKDPFFADMFKYKYSQKKPYITAGTSKRITIGSKMDEVLRNHRWPSYFLPFTTESLATQVFSDKKPAPELVSQSAPIGPKDVSTSFATGPSGTLAVNFATNCVMLYPDDNLALTLVNFSVIRIQIGRELAKPATTSFVPGDGGTAPAGAAPRGNPASPSAPRPPYAGPNPLRPGMGGMMDDRP